MTRRFRHNFSPRWQGTHGHHSIELTTTEIAEAAIREIVQIGLTTVPFDLFVEQLLVPLDRWFRWIQPLGHVRETKTALSGLFGRFVARAYLTRYLGFRHFEPIRSDTQHLQSWPNFTVRRRAPGDLPDWLAASAAGANDIAIAEAKGSHNRSGPGPSLAAALRQVNRIDVLAGRRTLRLKRYAIATRWAIYQDAHLIDPWLVVQDPDEGEREPSAEELRLLKRSIALGHFGALAEGFGLKRAAEALRQAKNAEPGNLQIELSEFTRVQTSDGTTKIMAAAFVTPAGLMQVPNTDVEEFRSALRTVYGQKTLLFGFDIQLLKELDAIWDTGAAVTATPEEPPLDRSFWEEAAVGRDGSQLIPLEAVSLSRILPT